MRNVGRRISGRVVLEHNGNQDPETGHSQYTCDQSSTPAVPIKRIEGSKGNYRSLTRSVSLAWTTSDSSKYMHLPKVVLPALRRIW